MAASKDGYNEPTQNPTSASGEVVDTEEYPTAAILRRFSEKPQINVSEAKHKMSLARKETSAQARILTEANSKETKRQETLRKAREARKGGN